MLMLDLPDVTLCCVDTRSVPQALDAVSQCMAHARFGHVLFMGPDPHQAEWHIPSGVDWLTVPELRGIEDYNRIMLRDLAKHVPTSHVLIVQWDGFITNPNLWRPEFLEWDYIGAPWYHGGHPGRVGNGGFSLRSRKLLDALAGMALDTSRPEDAEICVHHRAELESQHGIRFAPLSLAQAFAHEYGPYRATFGFHGMHDFAHVMSPERLAKWLSDAPPEILINKHTRKLIKELIWQKRGAEARRLIKMRAHHLGWSSDLFLLMARTIVSPRSTHHV